MTVNFNFTIIIQEYSCQVTFREMWNDNRLQFDNMGGKITYLVLTDPNRIWKPDLFFSNEKKGHFHEIIMPNVLLRIYPNGNVLFSIRISLGNNYNYGETRRMTNLILLQSYRVQWI